MPLPDVRRLLDRLDRSHDADRVRTMALIGREGSGDPALAAFLDEVAAPSEYHQHLVLVAASAAGDARRLTAALRHPSLRIVWFLNRYVVIAGAVHGAVGSVSSGRRLFPSTCFGVSIPHRSVRVG